MTRIPALDGLRGLAILMVLAGHLEIPILVPFAPLGVTLFFVLSGFLITGILTRQADHGGVRFADFYRRRARRLLPALFVMLIVAAVIAGEGWWHQTWHAVFYLGNMPLIRGEDLGNITHVWSLAVEEHFYLAWPLVIAAVPSRWRLRVVALTVVALGTWRLGLSASGADWSRVYYGTDTNAFAILTGCLVSVGRFGRFSPIAGLAALSGIGFIGMLPLSAGYLFLAVPLAAVAVHVGSASVPALEVRWLRWFGDVSYGLYLWHIPLFEQFDGYRPLLLPVVVVAGWLSWRLVERPFLRRGETAHLPWNRRGVGGAIVGKESTGRYAYPGVRAAR